MTATSSGAPEHWPASPFESFRPHTPDMGFREQHSRPVTPGTATSWDAPSIGRLPPSSARALTHATMLNAPTTKTIRPCSTMQGLGHTSGRSLRYTRSSSAFCWKAKMGASDSLAVHGDGVGDNSQRRPPLLVQPRKPLGARLAVLRNSPGTAACSVGRQAWELPRARSELLSRRQGDVGT